MKTHDMEGLTTGDVIKMNPLAPGWTVSSIHWLPTLVRGGPLRMVIVTTLDDPGADDPPGGTMDGTLRSATDLLKYAFDERFVATLRKKEKA